MANFADETFMRAALAEARRGIGRASPNPAVGAVLVQRGRITATGYHRASGLPHAEIFRENITKAREASGRTQDSLNTIKARHTA